ncbi:protein BTG4 [Paramormyrops kingsleyae]|uniref:B-cell translocation gene 4 n=1 Tax=Paramormyrops kingsleyae TaxID=1676925 RepID=A0A3B3RNB8_9TELE|nr:maternal B9.15 protein-like [Paramormyrops kingsleyae]
MKEEIAATVFFITRLAKKHGKLDRRSREKFAVELTSVLFEKYKSHWYPDNPSRGQAFRCLRMNKAQCKDAVLDQACRRSDIDYDDLGLPKEMTIWVDPFEVSCRYGEKSSPFCVAPLESHPDDGEFSRWINSAVEKASSDYHSGSSSDEESGTCNSSVNSSLSSGSSLSEHKSIPTVSNPNSVYQASEFSKPVAQPWSLYPKRKIYSGDGYQQHQTPVYYLQNKPFKNYRASFAFSGPRVDRYHWVSKNRS